MMDIYCDYSVDIGLVLCKVKQDEKPAPFITHTIKTMAQDYYSQTGITGSVLIIMNRALGDVNYLYAE